MVASTLVLDRPAGPAQPAIPASAPAPLAVPRGLGVVGARFPRAWAERQVLAPLQSAAPTRVYPIGCRFPRRTAADEQTYLATAMPTVAIRPLARPVGARFPR